MNKVKKNNKIKIGYFSSDFCIHPVMYLLINVLENHNKEIFEIHAFSYGVPKNDSMNDRVKNSVDKFHNVFNLDNKEIDDLAKIENIDISIDLNGYTEILEQVFLLNVWLNSDKLFRLYWNYGCKLYGLHNCRQNYNT